MTKRETPQREAENDRGSVLGELLDERSTAPYEPTDSPHGADGSLKSVLLDDQAQLEQRSDLVENHLQLRLDVAIRIDGKDLADLLRIVD